MTAKIVTIDGKEIKTDPIAPDEGICDLLRKITTANEDGELRAVVCVAVYDDNTTRKSYAVSRKGVQPELLIGLLESTKDKIKRELC